MSTIYVGCPANRFTGGPTLAHQLCYSLNQKGYNAVMYYYHSKKNGPYVHENYKKFNNPWKTKIIDSIDSIVIAPETAPDILKGLKRSKKIIWWMSVDNYFDKYLTSRRNKVLNICGLLKYNVFSKSNYHFAQSYYAIDFLVNRQIAKDHIFYLSDYIDKMFIDSAEKAVQDNKEDIIVYSPKRGIDFTKKIINLLPEYRWVALENMTQEEMINTMSKSKLYVDFGNHPGKDRIPREATLCGCCIITSKLGSAANNKDINIDSGYKFESIDTNLDLIQSKINDVMNNYESHIKNFRTYKEKIMNEESQFNRSIDEIFRCFNIQMRGNQC